MEYSIRPARTSDVNQIIELVRPLVSSRILLGKDPVIFYESIQEFKVAVSSDGEIIACGALHVFWEDLGEIRTVAVSDSWRKTGVGRAIVNQLIEDAKILGLSRLFCLTFEVEFFTRLGFKASPQYQVDSEVFAELLRSPDEGVAEFLELDRVKPNTLGNTRMILRLDD